MKICIYCLGDYGVFTYYRLCDVGIAVDFFGDIDPSKTGYALNGIYCKSYQDIIKMNSADIEIIVCIQNPRKIIEDFRSKGFSHVLTMEEAFEKYIANYEKKAPIQSLEHIQKIKTALENPEYIDNPETLFFEKDFMDLIRDKRNEYS